MHLPHHRISNLAAFLVPALSLWLPSGYAYGTALLVVGATVLMLVAIAHQSLRKPRAVVPATADEESV